MNLTYNRKANARRWQFLTDAVTVAVPTALHREALRWAPRTALAEGLKPTVEWFQNV